MPRLAQLMMCLCLITAALGYAFGVTMHPISVVSMMMFGLIGTCIVLTRWEQLL